MSKVKRKRKYGWMYKSVINGQNLPINNPIPYLNNINARTKFGENRLKFTKLSPGNENTDGWEGDEGGGGGSAWEGR